MEYTKVQTALNHVKDAITTKLDAIKSDVTNVNNSVTNLPATLDSKFSALTSKVDGVKTDVAGVGSKVDAGVTTLGGKVDGALNIAKEDAAIARYFNVKSTKNIYAEIPFGSNSELITVRGKGTICGLDIRQLLDANHAIKLVVDGRAVEYHRWTMNSNPIGEQNWVMSCEDLVNYEVSNSYPYVFVFGFNQTGEFKKIGSDNSYAIRPYTVAEHLETEENFFKKTIKKNDRCVLLRGLKFKHYFSLEESGAPSAGGSPIKLIYRLDE